MDIKLIRNERQFFDHIKLTYKGETSYIPCSMTGLSGEDLPGLFSTLSVELSRLELEHDKKKDKELIEKCGL